MHYHTPHSQMHAVPSTNYSATSTRRTHPQQQVPVAAVDEATLEHHMGAVRRYYEQRLQQLEDELAKCRRTCSCHGRHDNDVQQNRSMQQYASPSRQLMIPPLAAAAAAAASSSSSHSLMVSPISYREPAVPLITTTQEQLLGSSELSFQNQREVVGSGGSHASSSPSRYPPPSTAAVNNILSYDHHRLPPQYPRLQQQQQQQQRQQHQSSQQHSGANSSSIHSQPAAQDKQQYQQNKPITATNHFFALPAQDYFRETLREVAFVPADTSHF